jgi:hypothetical protein
MAVGAVLRQVAQRRSCALCAALVIRNLQSIDFVGFFGDEVGSRFI